MILVLAVLVALVVGAGFIVTSLTSGGVGAGPERGRSSTGVGATLVLVAAGLVVVLILFIGAGFVLRGSGGTDDDAATPTTTPEPNPAPVQGTVPSPKAPPVGHTPIAEAPPELRVVAVQGSDPGRASGYVTVDRLGTDSVVHVQAAGFAPFEQGFVAHCVSKLGLLPSRAGRFPVQFGEDGGADFQFQLRSSFAPGACRYGRATCTLRLTGADSGRSGEVQTVVGAARPGEVRVAPQSGLQDRTTVGVSVTDFPPGTSATALLCAPLGGYDARRCGGGSAAAQFRVGPDGSGRTELDVRTGSVGIDRHPCGPRHPCGVLVVTGDGFVASPSVPLHFSLGPGATYNSQRLAVGLTIALTLGISALFLARRTDWTKPTEAATPEIDAADLQTQGSLDDLFGTDEEIDARDPIPS